MTREQILEIWLREVFKSSKFTISPLAGDASFRRYYRILTEDMTDNTSISTFMHTMDGTASSTYVVMDAPPPEVPNIFVDIAEVLAKQGITVPKILASNLEYGFLLLTDLGDQLYLPELKNPLAVDKLYSDALETLLKIQQCKADVPKFTHDFLKRQFGIFQTWYLEKHKGVSCNASMRASLESIETHLIDVILQQPQVFVHRDYHSRNLMIVNTNGPGVIDFQDAMIGPITYDLVSLLQDCYITWPRARVITWVKDFQGRAFEKGILATQENSEEFLRWFDWTGLQRHLKNLGIFARLHHRDGKSQYLKDIPRVLHYIKETCTSYPELSELWTFLETLAVSEMEMVDI